MSGIGRVTALPQTGKYNEGNNNSGYKAWWDKTEAALGGTVGINVTCDDRNKNIDAIVHILFVEGGRKTPHGEPIKARLANGELKTTWTTTAPKAGNYKAGTFQFRVNIGGLLVETEKGLKLADTFAQKAAAFQKTYQSDSFESGPPKR